MDVIPFRGYRYDAAVVGDAGRCAAPPYDVIDAAQQQELLGRSEFNIVGVIRGEPQAGDGERENVYTRAAE